MVEKQLFVCLDLHSLMPFSQSAFTSASLFMATEERRKKKDNRVCPWSWKLTSEESALLALLALNIRLAGKQPVGH